ncbi:MAG: hypothetical protein GY903_07285 [Fuerstiella sp.]|nr:hypothetical protein [Fuerstiella sp.]MCP4854279.1 hypothetical protein [Fuerstiella sp.]
MNNPTNHWSNLSCLAIVLVLGVHSAQVAPAADSFQWHEGEGTRTLRFGDVEWFTYQYLTRTFKKVPHDDTRRTRGCYIHTLRGLDGEILTHDAPNDHVHHHGIFWAWPHVKIDGVEHRLRERPDIFQKFEKWLELDADENRATLAVQNGWYLGDRKLTTSIPDGPNRSGVAIMVSPGHPDYPPTWLTRCYGALCVGWPGVEEQTLSPGKPVTLAYRFRIHRGEPNVREMTETYEHYLNSLSE